MIFNILVDRDLLPFNGTQIYECKQFKCKCIATQYTWAHTCTPSFKCFICVIETPNRYVFFPSHKSLIWFLLRIDWDGPVYSIFNKLFFNELNVNKKTRSYTQSTVCDWFFFKIWFLVNSLFSTPQRYNYISYQSIGSIMISYNIEKEVRIDWLFMENLNSISIKVHSHSNIKWMQ